MVKYKTNMVGRVGIEPTKAKPKDLQSSPFDHSGTDPKSGATYQTWTDDRRFTKPMLYQLS